MPLEYHTLTASDARTMSDLMYGGYSDDPVSQMMYPLPASEASKAATAEAIAASWGKNLNEHVLAIKDTDTGQIISWAHWFVNPPREGEEWKEFKEPSCPPDWNAAYIVEAMRNNWEKRIEIMGGKAYICESTAFNDGSNQAFLAS